MRKTVLGVAVVLSVSGCLERPGGNQSDWDVRGNYDLTYQDQIDLKLNIAGAIREATATGYGGVVDFGMHEGNPLTLDLSAHCAKEEVVCPNESFWDKVAIDQVNADRNTALHSIMVVDDTVHDLPEGTNAESRGGIVNQDRNNRFLVGLGLAGAAQGACGALAASVAVGRFTHAGESIETEIVYRDESGQPCVPGEGDGGTADGGAVVDGGDGATGGECLEVLAERLTWPAGAAVDGIEDGRVIMAWAGGCAFGPILVGATLTMQVRYDGVRTGDYDPPLGVDPPITVEGEVPPDEPIAAEGG
ncbi:MAG: hypothetical protein P1V51_03025 [Deltaproteobacteria bacterium]|nr:hypothetical protein [Deltaproteobacteria bacterium]